MQRNSGEKFENEFRVPSPSPPPAVGAFTEGPVSDILIYVPSDKTQNAHKNKGVLPYLTSY
jgi:hypothetical protein